MILYNFPHKGPFEYDKFIISVLSYSNETKMLLNELKNEEEKMGTSSLLLDQEIKKTIEESKTRELTLLLSSIR